VANKASFVGINKHLDPAITELGGARRDATALWALFTDTIDGRSARLLLDEVAIPFGFDCDPDQGWPVPTDFEKVNLSLIQLNNNSCGLDRRGQRSH